MNKVCELMQEVEDVVQEVSKLKKKYVVSCLAGMGGLQIKGGSGFLVSWADLEVCYSRSYYLHSIVGTYKHTSMFCEI